MYDTLVSSKYRDEVLERKQTESESESEKSDRSWVKDLDLSLYRGKGKKMFPDIDAQDYVRELRDCDRTF